MSVILLQNEHLQARIEPRGAELQSLRHANGIEYMWQAGSAWPKHSPVLFPIVGSLAGGHYQHQGQAYSLPRHGMARDHSFDNIDQTDNRCVLQLRSTPAMQLQYPFSFVFEIAYELRQHSISVTYSVQNEGEETMYFSVGGHPAFAWPLVPGSQPQQHYLQWQPPVAAQRWLLQDGLLSGETADVPLNAAGQLPLSAELFAKDALVFRQWGVQRVTYASHDHAHGLHFDCADFPDFGIWSAPGGAFVCLEPWCGHADFVQQQGQLSQKAGIIPLPAGQLHTCSWQVTCF